MYTVENDAFKSLSSIRTSIDDVGDDCDDGAPITCGASIGSGGAIASIDDGFSYGCGGGGGANIDIGGIYGPKMSRCIMICCISIALPEKKKS